MHSVHPAAQHVVPARDAANRAARHAVSRAALAALAAGCIATACTASGPESPAYAADLAADSAELSGKAATLVALFTDVAADAPPERAAAAAAAQIATRFRPASCTQATIDGATVTVEISRNCLAAPAGLWLDGRVVATYSQSASGLSVAIDGASSEPPAARFSVRATATLSGTPGARVMQIAAAEMRDEGDHVGALAQSGTLLARWDGECIGVDGTLTVRSGLAQWDGAIDGYRRCSGACARSGTIALTRAGSTTRLAFNGGQAPQATSSASRYVQVFLRCTSASARDR